MGTWSNSNHTWYDDDMDSSNGTVAKKLRVRNVATTPPSQQTHRVEILERAHPLEAHDALKINGDVVLDYYGNDDADHLAGSLTVEPAGLFVNARHHPEASGGDPDVHIGWQDDDPDHPGNRVYIGGMENAIGPGVSPRPGFAVTLGSSVKVPQVTVEQLDADVQVEGTVQARKVDALSFGTDHVLGLGRASATTVEVGHPGTTEHPELGEMRIKGQLKAEQPATFQQGVTITGATRVQGELWASSLVVPGTANIETITVQGNITGQGVTSTVTAPRIVGTGTVTSEGSVECLNVASLKDEGCFHYVPASVRSDRREVSTLAVEHLHEENQDAALHVVNHSTLPEGIGGYFQASRAIVAEGEVQIEGRVVMNGEAVHANPVLMQGQPIILGGGGENEVKMIAGEGRLEFYIGGKMTFYIDINGGHNA